MARIPQETIEAVKKQVDLLSLVRAQGVKLTQHGRNWKGVCPFHQDKDPSLVVTPHKQLWNCFGCEAGGDAYQWIMKVENVDFRRAHEILSERFGGEATQSVTPPIDMNADGQRLLQQVVDYYHERLAENEAAMKYLKSRGIGDEEAIASFKIGFADRTLGTGLPVKQVQAGAQIRSKLQQIGILRSSGHEQFNGCVVFPVFDTEGNVSEIYGRKIVSSQVPALHLVDFY